MLVPQGLIGRMRQKQFDHVSTAPEIKHISGQWRIAMRVLCIDLSTSLQQQLRYFDTVFPGDKVQGSLLVFVARVNIGAGP